MQAFAWLKDATQTLKSEDITTARLDSLVLLEDVTAKGRAWLLANLEFELASDQKKRLDEQIARRANHEPLAYIRGKTEFYGREFKISPHTLEPRPETETMIGLCIKSVSNKDKIADVGAGSGAIGITIALEIGNTAIDLIEIDDEALKIAKQNCKKHSLKLGCLKGDLLNVNKIPYDVIVTNLPYVPDSHTVNKAAMQEPKHAIFGGPDGLDLYRQLFVQLNKRAHQPRLVFTESLPFQHSVLAKIAKTCGYRLQKSDDFIQVFEKAD